MANESFTYEEYLSGRITGDTEDFGGEDFPVVEPDWVERHVDHDPMLLGALQCLLDVQQSLVTQPSDVYAQAEDIFWQCVTELQDGKYRLWNSQDCRDLVMLLAMWHGFESESDGSSETNAQRFIRYVAQTLVEKRKGYGKSLSEPLNVFSSSDSIEQCASRIDTKISRLMFMAPGTDTEDTKLDLAGYLALMVGLCEVA